MKERSLSNVDFVMKVFSIKQPKKHIESVHEKKKPFKLGLCKDFKSKTFKTHSGLGFKHFEHSFSIKQYLEYPLNG